MKYKNMNITIIGISAMAKAVAKIDKTKYETILIFGDYFEPKAYKGYNTYLVGRKTLQGHGTGNDLEQGRLAFEESKEEIVNMIHNDYVIVVCGLSRGMSGGLTTLVKAIIDSGKKVFVMVTTPCNFEGPQAKEKSNLVINKLKEITDNFCISDGQELIYSMSNKISIIEFFKRWDNELYNEIMEFITDYKLIFK